ncbi:hypothetical protein K474DRAFT_1669081 [Panus rudis PR-1116 ss-1]|nr:hypothetical protein K474DRAFT_1669081 [Panus rudis PR-1116 ss-1]
MPTGRCLQNGLKATKTAIMIIMMLIPFSTGRSYLSSFRLTCQLSIVAPLLYLVAYSSDRVNVSIHDSRFCQRWS